MPEDEHHEVACRREFPRVHAMRVRGPVNEPAGDVLNNLPQSVIYSWRRLVLFCFHARRVYGKTGKTTFASQGAPYDSASASLRLRVGLFSRGFSHHAYGMAVKNKKK